MTYGLGFKVSGSDNTNTNHTNDNNLIITNQNNETSNNIDNPSLGGQGRGVGPSELEGSNEPFQSGWLGFWISKESL